MKRPYKKREDMKRSPEIEDEIIHRLSEGEPLRAICREEHMPGWVTIYNWMHEDESFHERIAQARELGQDAIFEDALRLADTPILGEEYEEIRGGEKVIHKIKRSEMLGHRKLQIETRLKLLAKWNPKRYGDRLHSEVTGGDGSPLSIRIVRFGDDDQQQE